MGLKDIFKKREPLPVDEVTVRFAVTKSKHWARLQGVQYPTLSTYEASRYLEEVRSSGHYYIVEVQGKYWNMTVADIRSEVLSEWDVSPDTTAHLRSDNTVLEEGDVVRRGEIILFKRPGDVDNVINMKIAARILKDKNLKS